MLCSRFVSWVIAHDAAAAFRFTAAQGELGQALYNDLGVEPSRFDTLLLIDKGVAHFKLAAVIRIAQRLGGVWRAASVLRILPRPVGDWLYDRVASNRYALFGRREVCWLPAADRVI